MLIRPPSAVAPGPMGATVLAIDGHLGVAVAVAVAAVAAGILAQVLHARMRRRGTRAAGARLQSLPTRRAA